MLQFEVPERDERHGREDDGELVADVATERADLARNDADIVGLDHAEDEAGHAAEEGEAAGEADGHERPGVPRLEVVVGDLAVAEQVMFDEDDGEVARVDVAPWMQRQSWVRRGRRGPDLQQRQEVLEVGQELVAADDAQQQDDDEQQQSPDDAGDGLQLTGNLLHGESAGVDGDAVHANARQHEDDEDELGKAVGVQERLDQVANAHLVLGVPRRVHAQSGADDAAEEHADAGGDGDAERGEPEDLVLGGVDRVLHVVVADDGAPRRAGAVDDGDERQAGAGQVRAGQRARAAGVGLGARLAVHDEEDDKDDHPGELLVAQHAAQADEAEDDAAHGGDDDADNQTDAPVGHGVQGQAAGDAADGAPADLLDGVDDGNDLGGPPAQAVAGNGHLAEAHGRAHGRAPAGDGGAQEGAEEDAQHALHQVQAELPAQEAGGEAGQVHGARRPQREHDPLRGRIVARLRQHAVRAVAFDAKLAIQHSLPTAHGREDPEAGEAMVEVGQLSTDVFGVGIDDGRDAGPGLLLDVGTVQRQRHGGGNACGRPAGLASGAARVETVEQGTRAVVPNEPPTS